MNDVVNSGVPLDIDRPVDRPANGLAPVVGSVLSVVVLLFAFLALLHERWGVDVRILLRDPAETADIPEYAGAYMYAGVLLLWTAGIVGVLAGLLLRNQRVDQPTGRLLLGMGAFLCWLAADDLFMIHEWLGLALSRLIGVENEYLGRTRLEGVVFVSYGGIALTWTWRNRGTLMGKEPVLFAAAAVCFALSAGVDIAGSLLDGVFTAGGTMETIRAYSEDMLKLAGIMFMLVYVVRVARTALLRPQASPGM
jgi:hypothetical protein